VKVRPLDTGGLSYVFTTHRISESDERDYEEQLNHAHLSLLEQIQTSGITLDMLRTGAALLHIYIGLMPGAGSVGTNLTARMIEDWNRLSADIVIEVL